MKDTETKNYEGIVCATISGRPTMEPLLCCTAIGLIGFGFPDARAKSFRCPSANSLVKF